MMFGRVDRKCIVEDGDFSVGVSLSVWCDRLSGWGVRLVNK
jgi:hypothetical protein